MIDAKYTSGGFKGKRVETATNYINRVGITYNNNKLSGTVQLNNVGDITNTKRSNDPVASYIPAYNVLNISATYHIKNYSVKEVVNNVTDHVYFMRRTDEYPGPGIIPFVGRSFYVGLTARL